MKYVPIILAFLAGVTVASAIWGHYLVQTQMELAVQTMFVSDADAKIGEQMLSYMESPDPIKARHLSLIASNHIAWFPHEVNYWDSRFPYIHIKQRFAIPCENFQTFLQEWNAKTSTNGMAGGQK